MKEARDLLAGLRQQQSAGSVDDLARQAEALAGRQQESNAKMRRAFGAPGQQQAQGVTPQRIEELAREKEQLANDYQRLESDMGAAARDMRATDRPLSSKLRDALGQVQQNEINNRLRLSADWLRTDRGPQATMRDAVTTQALNNLRDQLREIQKSMGDGQQGAGDKDRQALEQALAQTEGLRKEMERGMRGQQQGQQPGQQKGNQPGQQLSLIHIFGRRPPLHSQRATLGRRQVLSGRAHQSGGGARGGAPRRRYPAAAREAAWRRPRVGLRFDVRQHLE